MFNNPFLKKDPLVEAVRQAQQDGDMRRQAEAYVNEQFGVYSRQAVVRENLAAYDAALEEAYKCMKEAKKEKLDTERKETPVGQRPHGPGWTLKKSGQQTNKPNDTWERKYKKVGVSEEKADKDYDKDGKVESPKDEVWGSRLRAAKASGKYKGPVDEKKMWEEEKELSPKQKKMAAVAGNPKKIDAPDLAALRAGKKMDEAKGTAAVQNLKHRDFKETRHPNKGAVTKAPVPGVSIAEEDQLDEISNKVKQSYVAKRGSQLGSMKYGPDRVRKPLTGRQQKNAVIGIKRAMKEETQIDEAAYSAKAARKGKDIGKPGKMFSKIAKSAGERYGSEERGRKVAGAILKRIRAKHMKEENLSELSAFGSAFAAARKSGQSNFSFGGKSFTTQMKGQTGGAKPAAATPSSGMSAGTAAARTSGGSLPSMTSSSTPTPVAPKPPAASPNLGGTKWSDQGARERASSSASQASTIKQSGGEANVQSGTAAPKAAPLPPKRPEATPTTPGSTSISAQPAPTSGPSGEQKMKTMASLKESVQVGENKYRIV